MPPDQSAGSSNRAPEPVIVLDGVRRHYGHAVAVDNVSLSIRRGEMFGLIGPDGAGKTTAIRLIAGLLPATGGTVTVLGYDPVRQHRPVTGHLGYLSQRFSLYGDLTIDENIAFFAEIHGVADFRARRDRLLELTQLLPFRRRLADQLSGGMKQKLALACTLVHQPDIILLDEPTTGVDPVSRREFWKLLAEFLHQGLTILMATPYLDEAERCSRVALLHEGRLIALDDPSTLRAAFPGHIFEVVAEPFAKAQSLVLEQPIVEGAQSFGERLHVRFRADAPTNAAAALHALLESAGLDRVVVRPVVASLEDVFIERIRTASASSSRARLS
ncbi:MAG: ABC transporter ATP-binding protein [Vicinamibacterales bacterium]